MYNIDYFDGTHNKPTIFVVFHKKTKQFTIGITNKPSSVVRLIYWQIEVYEHKNKKVNALARDCGLFYHLYFPFETMRQAAAYCEELIDIHKFNPDYIGRPFSKKSVERSGVDPRRLAEISQDIFNGGETRYIPRKARVKAYPFPGYNTQPLPRIQGLEGLKQVTPTLPADHDKTISMYLIYFPKTKRFYVGSTQITVRRLYGHYGGLINGSHPNERCLAEFELDDSPVFYVFQANNRDHAYELEQMMIDLHLDSGRLLNICPDVKGRISAPETIEKFKKNNGGYNSVPVMAKGVLYPTISAAATAFGIAHDTMAYRLDSPNFPEFYRVT